MIINIFGFGLLLNSSEIPDSDCVICSECCDVSMYYIQSNVSKCMWMYCCLIVKQHLAVWPVVCSVVCTLYSPLCTDRAVPATSQPPQCFII